MSICSATLMHHIIDMVAKGESSISQGLPPALHSLLIVGFPSFLDFLLAVTE